MRVKLRMSLMLGAMILVGCQVKMSTQQPTVWLEPVVADGADVELMPAAGYVVMLSHRKHSDLSVFGIAHRGFLVFWVHYLNIAHTTASFEPWRIRVSGVDSRGREKILRCMCGEDKRLAHLHEDLTGVNRVLETDTTASSMGARLSNLREEWKRHHENYRTIAQVMMKGRPVESGESMDGYVVVQRATAQSYILRIPFAEDLHEFELAPKTPEHQGIPADLRSIMKEMKKVIGY